MKIYYFDEATRALIGDGTADPDPMTPGSYLVPANATPVPPPSAPAGMVAVFTTGIWQVVSASTVPGAA